ncbi:hypothetical protein [Mesorhizobium sp.]|uniref:hypothetical protein n=1 Tax=Mesorhizobium sp. TaxID=1871066 RepID=UPI0025C71AA5|nr:hypothetical protein [Mesorhizobium sp.]
MDSLQTPRRQRTTKLTPISALERFRSPAPFETNRAKNETIPPPARHGADTIRDDKARRNKGFGAMIKAEDIVDGGKPIAKLRPAGSLMPKLAHQPAGPFEIAAEAQKPTMRDALMTGLLVIYPAFAAVAAILAGLFLAGAGGV